MRSPTSASARTAWRRTSASRRGLPRARAGCERRAARDQGLRTRRLRQPDAREVLAHAVVPGRRRGPWTQPRAGPRARGAPHAARRARRRAHRRGRDGRRHACRGLAARAARVGADARGAPARGDRRRASCARCWAAVDALGGANLAHGQIDPASLRVVDGASPSSISAAGPSPPSPDERLSDRAQLLATTAAVAGTERARRRGGRRARRATESPGCCPTCSRPPSAGRCARRQGRRHRRRRPARRAAAARPGAREARARCGCAASRWGVVIQIALLVFAAAAVLSFVSERRLGRAAGRSAATRLVGLDHRGGAWSPSCRG